MKTYYIYIENDVWGNKKDGYEVNNSIMTNIALYFKDENFSNKLLLKKLAEYHQFSIKQAEKLIEEGRKISIKINKAKRKQDHIFKLQKVGLCIDFEDLKKIEKRAHRLAEDCCNFLSMESKSFERRYNNIKKQLKVAFNGNLPDGLLINMDARGYALKVNFEDNVNFLGIQTDFGGYGILCPDEF